MTDISRRLLLTGAGALGAASTARGAPAPTSDIPGLEFAFEELVTLEPMVEVGATPYGTRRRIGITGGRFLGPRIRGQVLPGGADWQLQRADDYTIIEADYMLQADDGTRIHIRNTGLTNSRVKGAPIRYLRTIPSFEAPRGPHEWLNQSVFVGTLAPAPDLPTPAVRIRIYRVT